MNVPPGVAWPSAADELDRWVATVARHPLWERASGDPSLADQRRMVAELMAHLTMLRRDGLFPLADDPWQDLELARRMTDRLHDLVGLLPAQARLSAAEVALLLAAPFLYDTLWATLAAGARVVRPHDLSPSQDATSDRAAFERFAQSYAQPYRRALAAVARGQLDAAEEIGWWLLHRWIARQPGAYRPGSLADLLAPVHVPGPAEPAGRLVDPQPPTVPSDHTVRFVDPAVPSQRASADGGTFAAGRVAGLLWAMRADPGFLARTDRPDALRPVAPDGVRERLLGYLLVAARGLAMEPGALPEVVGEHLGIVDPVTSAGLRATIAAAKWQPRGTTLVLDAVCDHPAIEVALRSHIDLLNQVLTEVQRAASSDEVLAGLRALPTHITTDGLRPAEVDGSRAYQSAGVRFRLAEDRVQELLMGEQLYGDPALAIRELYQNALDACRYREARTEYLHRTASFDDGWSGAIRFEQGVDETGRPYLDCVDNGIGMGVRELSEVFAQAGVRLGDLPEFIEEQAEWSRLDPPVQLFPNSRFGIGVLSYFMLADEITVDTCRMGRDGLPGQRLRVSIAGPGSLFRIRELGPGQGCGTTIRLHLRGGSSVSCVDTLRHVLWVADFATTASDGSGHHAWAPGELSEATPPQQAAGKSGEARTGSAVVADTDAGVWWCTGDGAILADGLWAGQELAGAVVNLRRDLAPRLSVDRTKILAYREEDVERLLWQAVDSLTAAASAVLTYDWLYAFAHNRPLIADVIFDRALAGGYRQWTLQGDPVDAGIAGCFLPDSGGPTGPDQIVEWRLTALAAAGRYPKLLAPREDWAKVVRARPSDALILSIDIDGSAPWLDPVEIVPLAHLVRASRRIGRHPSEIAARLEELGFTTAVGHESIGSDPDDALFMSRDADSSRPWLDPAYPVVLPHLLKAAHRSGRPLREVTDRMARLGFGFATDPQSLPLDGFDPSDLVLASRDLDAAFPWLDPAEPVRLLHLIRVAHKVNREVSDVAARLAVLGYGLPPGCEGLQRTPHDLVLISRDLDRASPWLEHNEQVTPLHLLRCAKQTGLPVAEVAARLTVLGFTVGVDPAVLADVELEPEDVTLLSRDLGGSPPWLDVARPVSTLHLLRTAEARNLPVATVAARFTRLGYHLATPPEEIIVDHLDPDDAVITSIDLDGAHPWLNPEEPVSAVHLIRASRVTGRDVHDITARLTVFGYTVRTTVGEVSVDQLTRDDLVIASQDLDGADPWLRQDEPVGLPHLLQASRRLRKPASEVAARLRQLGYTVDVDLTTVAIDKIRSNDLTYASNDLDGTRPWLDRDRPVSLSHILAAANKTHQPVVEVTSRLTLMGYLTPDLDVRLPRAMPGGV